eukprot:XP_011444069.1 PREDICTED: uncharacterized protein LOC105339966 [Crassostrea gigas]
MLNYIVTLLWILRAITATTRRNCEDWRLHGYTKSATFNVEPKQDGIVFSVYCDMTSVPAQTVFKHDFNAREHVGYAVGGWYADVNPVYSLTMQNIESAILLTSSCQQYIKYECNSSKLLLQKTYSKWESRDSVKRYYWGDANQQSGYCACGLTGTCADPAKECNCLIEDDTLREDSGYLTDSSLLPVTRVVIRMSSFSSDGYLTIGPMTCVDVDPRSFIETPEGIATAFTCSVLFLIFLFMVVYACYKKRPCKKCGKSRKQRTDKSTTKPHPAEKPTVEATIMPESNNSIPTSSSMEELPRGPLHAIMPPSYTVHNFPLQNYKPGELSRLLGAQNEAELVHLRMELNARPYPQQYAQVKEKPKIEASPSDDQKIEQKHEYNWNVDSVLLVKSLIAREQAARQTSGKSHLQHSAASATRGRGDTAGGNQSTRLAISNSVSNASNMTGRHLGVSLSNIEDLYVSENSVNHQDETPDVGANNERNTPSNAPSNSNQINYTNIQMVKDIIAQEKLEKIAQNNADSNQSKGNGLEETKTIDQSNSSFDQQRDVLYSEHNGDWD